MVSVVETGDRQLSGRSGAGRTGTLGSVTATYDMGSADRMLLGDLAAVETSASARDDAVSELAAGLRKAGRPVPVFAVLAGAAPAELGALASPSLDGRPRRRLRRDLHAGGGGRGARRRRLAVRDLRGGRRPGGLLAARSAQPASAGGVPWRLSPSLSRSRA